MMAEAQDTQGALAAERDAEFFPLKDLPNDVLVSVFAVAAAEDQTWVRHTFPCVCKAWNELYCSQNASPLHETLELDFEKEVEGALAAVAAAAAAARERGGRRRGPVVLLTRSWRGLSGRADVDDSRFISWAQGRVGSVRKLLIKGGGRRAVEDFSPKDLGRLVFVVAPHLTEISVRFAYLSRQYQRSFWDSLRNNVVPLGKLRSFVVEGDMPFADESGLEPLLGQLAGSLEELVLSAGRYSSALYDSRRFPECLLALKELRRLGLSGHFITAIPAGISSLKKLEDLDLQKCGLSSLPKELGELSRLTKLDLGENWGLGTTLPADEAFPAELGKLKSLRVLNLNQCRLRTVPAFVGELESLESLSLRCFRGLSCGLSSLPKELGELSRLTKLDLSDNYDLGRTLPADEAFPAELGNMRSLRDLKLYRCGLRTVPSFIGELKSLESLDLSNSRGNGLSSLPKELGELSRLTRLKLEDNKNLGTTLPAAEALPAELGKMRALRDLDLNNCGLRTVPSFVGKLKLLKSLDLRYNDLSSLPKELGELSGLTKLDLYGNKNLGITAAALPAELGKMKSLRVLDLCVCGLRTVPAFLGELSGLTRLDLGGNWSLGTTLPAAEAFPAALGKMKSLRELELTSCGLRTVPAFVGELESLETLLLHWNNDLQIDAPLDFLVDGCPRLRGVWICNWQNVPPWTPESRARLEAFKAKLLAKNPTARVFYGYG